MTYCRQTTWGVEFIPTGIRRSFMLFAILAAIGNSPTVYADGPVTIQQHQEHSFPTYTFWTETTLCFRSLDPGNWAKIEVQAGTAGGEEVGIGGDEGEKCIKRRWGGLPVRVLNIRGDRPVPVEVWTR